MGKHVQGSKEWLEMRRGHLGASDAPVVMKDSPWRTPFQLWEEKVGVKNSPTENFAMRRGTQMEPEARKAFEDATGLEVFPQVVFHPQHKFMMASLDGLTLCGDAVVEIKCPGSKDHSIAMKGKVPEHYKAQLQHQLACLSLEMLYYFSFDGTDGKIIEVERDEKYISQMIKEEEAFWKFVKSKTPPPFSEKDYELKNDSEWLMRSEEIVKFDKMIKEFEERVKGLKKSKDALKEELIKEAEGKSCKGGGIILTRSYPQGRVDYSAIPELQNVDLNKYRKQSKETWTLRIESKERK